MFQALLVPSYKPHPLVGGVIDPQSIQSLAYLNVFGEFQNSSYALLSISFETQKSFLHNQASPFKLVCSLEHLEKSDLKISVTT